MRLSDCRLCPRECGVDRLKGQRGFCKAGVLPQVYRYGPHRGEEPPISGQAGSGAVFFSRCTMRCVYCQNYPWSSEGEGAEYSIEDLAGIFRRLRDQGCGNWNLVSPTPWLPQIADALRMAEQDGRRLPVVYNTSGFEKVETLDQVSGWVDVFLTDLRYSSEQSAAEGSGSPGYAQIARQALRRMWDLTGPLREENGTAIRGTICRLLILPGRALEAVENLRWLADHVGTDLAVSVMAQYVPVYKAAGMAGWNRAITRREYDAVCEEATRLGFESGWIQEFEGETSPDLIGCRMRPGGHESMEERTL